MAKSTWRFLFVDINESITITEQDTKWIAYMAVRAPKGNLKADFIAPDNAAMIKAMFGYPSAHWTDIYDLIELNKEYGVYVSANPGASVEIPNYYGGYYQTSLGYLKMYCNTSKEDPNFEVSIKPNKMYNLFGLKNPTTTKDDVTTAKALVNTALNEPGEQAIITITDVPAKLVKSTSEIAFDYWNSKKPFRYTLKKSEGILYPSPDSVKNDADAAAIPCGTFKQEENGTFTFHIGGDSKLYPSATSWNTKATETKYGIPFIDYTAYGSSKYDYSQYLPENTEVADWTGKNDGKDVNYAEAVKNAILNGGSVEIQNGTIELSYSEALQEKIRFVFNCEDYVKSWVVQKSPTAQETTFKISNVVFDKWTYDAAVPYIFSTEVEEDKKGYLSVKKTATTPAEVSEDADTEAVTTIATPADFEGYETIVVMALKNDGKLGTTHKVYSYVETTEEDDNGDPIYAFVDVTEQKQTKRLLLEDQLGSTKDTNNVKHSIYYVTSDSTLEEMTEGNAKEELQLVQNPMWNTFDFEATEIDEEGELHTSGVFTGSLDEMALNPNGSEIYWEEVFPSDSATYAELHVYDTFEDDLDEKGYFTGLRENVSSLNVNSTGQRYIDKVVAENIANGNTGSNVTDATMKIQREFGKISKASISEAMAPKYDDARVFAECTGVEAVKDLFTGLRKAHNMSLIVSPKNIDANVFKKVDTMTVEGRCRGSIQYCQEIEFKDKNTRKKYYACPIGAMSAMIMRIKERALGALQADWLNNNNMGGQIEEFFIGRTPRKARWDFTDEDTKVMDSKGINPIVMDVDDGVMAVSSLTTELNAGDWCEIGHCSAFDECKREIRDKVMKPQLEKKINPFWMDVRERDTNDILKKWTGGADAAWAKGEVNIKDVNTDYTKAQRIFNIKVRVKVYPFSKWVKLTFINEAQTTTVSEE